MPPLIDSVVIIESLPHGEEKTGLALSKHLKKKGFEAPYHAVETQTQFLAAIQDAERRTRSLNERVALHFEVHGSEGGFHLADGTAVNWFRVKRDLQNLNFAQKNHLLVSMAVCCGLWLTFIVRATDTSPFHTLVACQEKVLVAGIQRGFTAFFESLFNGNSIQNALRELNLEQRGTHPDYTAITSEEMFIRAFRHYFKSAATPERLRARANAYFTTLVKKGRAPEALRRRILNTYFTGFEANQEPTFIKFRDKFFMHHEYPENMAEFCPAYDVLVTARATTPPTAKS